jgi:uncharacterized protein (UPF0248 family)
MVSKEEWKYIEDFENYEVSNLGKVRNSKTGRILKTCSQNGYVVAGLCKTKVKTIPIHRLVAKAFIPNPENKAHVNHIDKNPLNNNVTNLEWNTPLENNLHKCKGLIQTTNQNKCVCRIDKHTNEVLEKYKSIELAGIWLYHNNLAKNIHSGRTNISNAIRGVYKSSFGFKWEIEEQLSDENELWKEIKIDGFESENYYISDLGRFKNSKGIIMKNYKPHHSGYIYVRVNKKKFALHRLVALMFISNPENKPFVNHIDGNKVNNCLDNLEWVTCAENNKHNYTNNIKKKYTRPIIQYDLEMNELNKFNSIKEAGDVLNISTSGIKAVLYNKQKKTNVFIFKYLD